MGQVIDIVFDGILTFELYPHALQSLGQLAQFAAANLQQRQRALSGHRVRIAHQLADREIDPPDDAAANQQRNAQQGAAGPEDPPLAALNDRRHRQVGFTDAQHADNPPLIHHRRGDIHHRAGFIMRIAARTARAVLAAQGEPDIVPARIVLPCRLPAGVKHHLAPGIGQIDAVLITYLFNSANIGVERLLVELVKGLRQPALLRVCRQQILTRQRRQQGSGIIEGPLCRPAHARLHFLDKDRQHKPRGDRDDKKIAQQQAHADAHQPRPRL